MKTNTLALGLLLALNAHAAVTTKVVISGTVTAVKEHSIEIDGKSYPIDVKTDASGDLANVSRGDKVSIELSPAHTTAGAAQQKGHLANRGTEVVHPATAKLGAAQVQRARVTKPN